MPSLTPDPNSKSKGDLIFSGNILMLWAYDVGEDINLEKIEESPDIVKVPLHLPKHFKQYNVPLAIEHPAPSDQYLTSSKIHSFGAISLIYKIPFHDTLENLRVSCDKLAEQYQQQSLKGHRLITPARVTQIFSRVDLGGLHRLHKRPIRWCRRFLIHYLLAYLTPKLGLRFWRPAGMTRPCRSQRDGSSRGSSDRHGSQSHRDFLPGNNAHTFS